MPAWPGYAGQAPRRGSPACSHGEVLYRVPNPSLFETWLVMAASGSWSALTTTCSLSGPDHAEHRADGYAADARASAFPSGCAARQRATVLSALTPLGHRLVKLTRELGIARPKLCPRPLALWLDARAGQHELFMLC